MKPTVEQIKARLNTSDDQAGEVTDLIETVHAEMLAKLDRKVYADTAALTAAADPTGIVATKDMINAQILLVGYYLDQVGTQDGDRTRAAAMCILDRYRLSGA
ncbi:hypothetical protein [Noviherbaspirillum malthae]|uniref:hypothetical protein n=1 Tax=Noviherbaspirillum malthae TaxID=1260987 RepID=UPI00188EC2C9|nr:hypothetical protein [Noviherbaspirillum malthae]